MKVAIAFMLVALSCLFATCASFDLPQLDNLEPEEKYYYIRLMDICIEKYGTAMNTEAADKDFLFKCALSGTLTVVRELSDAIGCPMEEILQAMGISDMTLEEMKGVISGTATANDLDPEQCEDILIDLIEGLIYTVLDLLEGLLGPAFKILDGFTGEGGPLSMLDGVLGEGGGILGSVLGGDKGLLGNVLGKGLLGGLLGGDGGLLGGVLGGGLSGENSKGENYQSEEQLGEDLDEYVKDDAVQVIDDIFTKVSIQDGINSNLGGNLGGSDGSTFGSNMGQYDTSSVGGYGKGSVVVGSISEPIGVYDTNIKQDSFETIQETNVVEITTIREEDEIVKVLSGEDQMQYSSNEWEEESEKDDHNNIVSQITSSKGGKKEGITWETIDIKGVGRTIGESEGDSEESEFVQTFWEEVKTDSEMEVTAE